MKPRVIGGLRMGATSIVESGMEANFEEITPEEAIKMLDAQKVEGFRNRSISETHVNWLASQMKSGKWQLNGEAIILDEFGQLIDGQHRLWACVQSKTAFKTLVVRGASPKGFATIDTGKARTVANFLSISGHHNAAVIASVLGWLWRYERGLMLSSLKPTGFCSSIAEQVLKRHPNVVSSVEWAVRMKYNEIANRIPGSPLAFLHYRFQSYAPGKCEEFFAKTFGDISDCDGSPTKALRRCILNKKSGKMSAQEIMAVIVKAWAAYLNGDTVRVLMWRRHGEGGEDFPIFPGDAKSVGESQRTIKSK